MNDFADRVAEMLRDAPVICPFCGTPECEKPEHGGPP